MGNDPEDKNVIGKWPDDRYTSYTGTPNGVFGEAKLTNEKTVHYGEIPVEKVWSDGPEAHTNHPVYVLLYQNDTLVLDADGQAQLLRLDSANGWTGSFRVALPDKNTDPATLNYSVREIRTMSDPGSGIPAVLENDGVTVLYVLEIAEEEEFRPLVTSHYMVTYSRNEETGGHGTDLYTFSGLLLIAAALMLGCNHRRRRERGHGF